MERALQYLRRALDHLSVRASTSDEPLLCRPVELPDSNSPESIHNRTYSHLHRLPVELQLLVTQLLPPTAIISLRQTTRHFHRLLPNPVCIDPVEMHNFTKIKKPDNYLWNIRRERAFGIKRVEKITCSKCRCLHEKDEFSKAQLKQRIEKRVCKGAEGVVWICSHASFSFDEVRALTDKKLPLPKGEEMYNFYICTHPSHGSTGEELARSAPMICVTPEDRRRHHGGVLVLSSWTLIQVPNSDSVTQKQLKRGLTGTGHLICPHTSAENCRLVSQKSGQTDPSRSPFHNSQLDTVALECNSGACRACCSFAQFCDNIHCDTFWNIYRRHNEGEGKLDEVIIRVKRQVAPGSITSDSTPRNSFWESQMQAMEPGSSKPWRESTCVDGEVFLQSYSGEAIRLWLNARSLGFSDAICNLMVSRRSRYPYSQK